MDEKSIYAAGIDKGIEQRKNRKTKRNRKKIIRFRNDNRASK
jgi:hypothetical protein